jgi:hypothetical protein
VHYNPQWDTAESLFLGLAPALRAQVCKLAKGHVHAKPCTRMDGGSGRHIRKFFAWEAQ